MSNKNKIPKLVYGCKWVFFGTTQFSVIALDELKVAGFLPTLIITVEDKPKGRGLVMTPPEVKLWADKENIPCIQPKTLKSKEIVEKIKSYCPTGFDFFVVFSYGKIIPKDILDIPRCGALNIHPSLLPKLRGPSPVKSAILKENETGVTILQVDEEMDHGPILAQKKVPMPEWPPYESDLENRLSHEGGKLLAEILPDFITGKIKAVEQNHSKASFCQKIQKTEALLDMKDTPESNLRKIRAYHIWPGSYFFDDKKRVVVKRAHIENGELVLDRVIPEGKKEMSYKDYMNGKRS